MSAKREAENNSAHHSERKETRAQKTPNARARLGLYTPDGVERILQLPEDTARTEKGEKDPDDRCQQALIRLGRFLRDVLHNLHCAFIEKVAHLLGDFVPCAAGIVAKDQADYREQHEDERRERKDSVVSQSSA